MQDVQGTSQGILERELIRQAILIAARDELGLATRDELLDDAPPARAEGPPLEIAILFRPGECHALVPPRRGREGRGPLPARPRHQAGQQPVTRPSSPRWRSPSPEPSSPRLLKQLGLAGRPNKVRDDAPVPPDVEERLDQLGLVDHFAAGAVSCTQAIRADGESPGRLAALARALRAARHADRVPVEPGASRFQGPRVALCRAAAGAEPEIPRRAAQPGPSSGPWSAATTWRWPTSTRPSRLAEETKDATPAPSWLPVIDAYLKSDRKRLATPDGPHARLAALLGMMLVEYPHRTRVMVQAAQRPGGSRCRLHACAYDAICQNGQLGELHVATVAGPAVFTKTLPEKLKSLDSLPATVKQPLDRNRDEPDAGRGPRHGGRPARMRGSCRGASWRTWPARPASCRPIAGCTSWRTQWHVPAGDALEEFRPLVAAAPLLPLCCNTSPCLARRASPR